jgi:hypothetical protein
MPLLNLIKNQANYLFYFQLLHKIVQLVHFAENSVVSVSQYSDRYYNEDNYYEV